MDLIIKNASLEEVTAICYRIGEPNFNEMIEAHRKFGAVEYMAKHGMSLSTAEDTYDKDLQDVKIQVALKTDNEDQVPEAAQVVQETLTDRQPVQSVQSVQLENQTNELEIEPVQVHPNQQQFNMGEPLHLEQKPEVSINPDESLHQLATKLVDAGRTKELIEILESFNAKSIPDLNKNHYDAVIARIKEIL